MKVTNIVGLTAVCIGLVTVSSGCRRDMFNQPYSKPLSKSKFFHDEMASRPIVPNTVARGHADLDQALYEGKTGTNLVETFPFPITREVLERGQQRFDIYCAPCHGRTGDGDGMIAKRGFPQPPSYHIDRLRQAPVGHFYNVITHGYGIMYPYAARVDVNDRWAIAAYIRALQLSHHAPLDSLPPEKRTQLQASK